MSLPVALPLLVLAPGLAAVAVLAVPAPLARRAAFLGVALTALLALIVAVAHRGPEGARATLEDAFVSPGGPLSRALDAAGIDEPIARAEVRALLIAGARARAAASADRARLERARLEQLAGVGAARATLGWLQGEASPDPARVSAARGTLAEAEAAAGELEGRLAAVREATRRDAALVVSREGAAFSHVARWRWLPLAGAEVLLGVDDLSSALALVLAVIALAALLAAPDAGPGRATWSPTRRAAHDDPATLALLLAGLALAEACLVTLDLVLLMGAWALSAATAVLLATALVRDEGAGPDALAGARSLGLRAAVAAVALLAGALAVTTSVSADGPTGGLPGLALAAHDGQVGLARQGALLAVALLACALRLPALPGLASHRLAPVANPDPAREEPWLATWLWGSALPLALWPLVRAALVTPGVASGTAHALGAAAGGLLALGGGLLAWRAARDRERLAATAVACVGLALLGLGGDPGSSSAAGFLVLAGALGLAMAALGSPGAGHALVVPPAPVVPPGSPSGASAVEPGAIASATPAASAWTWSDGPGTRAEVWVRRLSALGLVTAVGAPGTVGFAALVLVTSTALTSPLVPRALAAGAVLLGLAGAVLVGLGAVTALRPSPATAPLEIGGQSSGGARLVTSDGAAALLVPLALLATLGLVLGALPWLVLPG